jgi:diacylglycerol O-acyltransferase / wax synthase
VPKIRMSHADAAWLGMDAPDNLMIVTGVLRLQGPADWTRLAEVVQERMVARYPAFRRRVLVATRLLRRRAWVDDPDFDLSRHLVMTALATDSDSGLADLVSELLGTPLDMTHSPWKFHLIDGPSGDSTIVARLHHSIGDGIALGSVLLSLTDGAHESNENSGAENTNAANQSGPSAPPLRLAINGARFAIGVVATGSEILLASRDPRTHLHQRLGNRKGAAWTRPIALDRLKAIGRTHGVPLNDVFLAITAGALRRHVQARGEEPHDLRMFMPVNVRPPGQPAPAELGNRFGIVFLSLPISVADAEQRLRAVHAHTHRLKAGQQAAATFLGLTVVGALPVWCQRLAARVIGAKASVVVTNVPGPGRTVTLAGRPLDQVMFWVPQPGSIGLGISILSYAGSVIVGIAADRNVLADPSALADSMEAEIRELENRLR